MGYFWDQLDRKWIPRPRWEQRLSERRRINRRRELLRHLIVEIGDGPPRPPAQFIDDAEYFTMIERNDRAAKLYASLLARTLIGTDEVLMKEWGKQIVELTAGGERVTP